MKLRYLKNKNWLEITREERQCCAVLYGKIRSNPKQFIQLCNSAHPYRRPKIELDEDAMWQIGFEVALNRDLRFEGWKFLGSHRKFDIVCFAENQMVVVEAKAHQGFSSAELKRFACEWKRLNEVLNKHKVCVTYIGICSKIYLDSPKKRVDLETGFDAMLTWEQIACCFRDETFDRADSVYNKKARRIKQIPK